ncbi:ATP-binding protein [Streptomyces sp. NPDC052013]|uniref:ATP-binding protein n=1 Tax=Streptomyces sp. NPDC052013 TaxID=3365679 RepID=UPI0037D8B0E7
MSSPTLWATTRPSTVPPVVRPRPRQVPGHQALVALPAEIPWVPVARRGVSAVLAQWRLPSADRASAELVVGELAANAAEHGRCDMTVYLSLHAGLLRISVTHSGAAVRPPTTQDTDPDEHGRGLTIVELLAQEIRVHQGPLGRRVSVALPTAAAKA